VLLKINNTGLRDWISSTYSYLFLSFVMSFINAGDRKKSAKRARTITVPVERPNVKVVFNFPVTL
jgi:hypothetical protein